MDLNSDGAISIEEAKKVLEIAGANVTEEEFNGLVNTNNLMLKLKMLVTY